VRGFRALDTLFLPLLLKPLSFSRGDSPLSGWIQFLLPFSGVFSHTGCLFLRPLGDEDSCGGGLISSLLNGSWINYPLGASGGPPVSEGSSTIEVSTR